MSNVTSIYRGALPAPEQNCIATVVEVKGGEAVSVTGLPGSIEPVAVSGHFSEVPPLKAGDRVAVMLTGAGPIVMARLRARGEQPGPRIEDEEGQLVLDAEKGIRLQCGESRIELTPDGRIWVDGREIYSVAAGRMRLQGAVIELN
ncbi:hypothetical protein DESUT3_00970 [Desulfuromonas versatilis]|uniref:Gp5/Type VI secretion system Vgr protein OB-fold domain-containing protein n=1 Tax=Desulfuromonas versatilis TaxID=2802975 RepID=A0ABN6DS29_9BACT|nr:hypothetical protein [Desulfuromonas versatilis]BCR03028.1 hypothetical protein DESUT3_00970 [Desulfuromonas versatilis]